MTNDEADELIQRCAKAVSRFGDPYMIGGFDIGVYPGKTMEVWLGSLRVIASELVNGRWDRHPARFNSHHGPRLLNLLRQAMVLDDLAAIE